MGVIVMIAKTVKADDGGLLRDGESRILQEHWDKVTAKGGEAALLLALGLTDKRQKEGAW